MRICAHTHTHTKKDHFDVVKGTFLIPTKHEFMLTEESDEKNVKFFLIPLTVATKLILTLQ